MTRVMLGSITYQALGVSARRVLDFLLHEHMSHGGQENGRLAAPYRQLVRWGVTRADIAQGLEELIVAGFVRKTQHGMRTEGGPPSRFALTWLPTDGWDPVKRPGQGAPATHDWLAVIGRLDKRHVGNVRAARKWLKEETRKQRR
jgi:hypothetical protein